jgi:hypothetical protein
VDEDDPPWFVCMALVSAIILSMGPPGTKRVMVNTIMVIPMNVGITKSKRLMKYAIMT